MTCNPFGLPTRLACSGCINLVKHGCINYCGLTGVMIPFPNLHVCCSYSGPTGSSEICRRCCDDDNCSVASTPTGTDCCTSHAPLNKCSNGIQQLHQEDKWCHQRCTTKRTSNLCRWCCDDCTESTTPDSGCECCRTVEQRINF